MTRALDMFRFYLGRLGRPGMAGLIMLLFALAYEYGVVLPRAAAAEAQRLHNEQALKTALRTSELEAAAEAGARTPMAPAATAVLRRLFEAAETAGLKLDRGEYRLTEVREANLQRYQFSLPVVGSYPDIRAFVTEALNADPALSLGAINLRRDSIETTEVEALLSFTLFLGEGA